jgi:hypothetical protein
MIDKQRGYHSNRPSHVVDTTVDIVAGMLAFLATNAAGVVVATTAASGTVPIGYFWKDRSSSFRRSTIESRAFSTVTGTINLFKGNVFASTSIRVTNVAGTTAYVQGTDYTVAIANGVITRVAGGTIAAGQTVVVWYEYTVTVSNLAHENVSTRWSTFSGQNYDHGTDDTLGPGQIAVVEGDAKLWTDQYDVTQVYTLNAPLYSNARSLWSVAVSATYPICGRVISIPTAADPWLGIDQIRVPQ